MERKEVDREADKDRREKEEGGGEEIERWRETGNGEKRENGGKER